MKPLKLSKLPEAKLSNGDCSGQNLTPSKMATCVPHLFEIHQSPPPKSMLYPTSSRSLLRGSLCFEDFCSEAPSVSKISAPNQAASATDHPWSSLTVTQPYFPPRS